MVIVESAIFTRPIVSLKLRITVLGLTLFILNFFIASKLIRSLLLFINGTLDFISEIETHWIPFSKNHFFSFLGGVFPILIFAIFWASTNFFSL